MNRDKPFSPPFRLGGAWGILGGALLALSVASCAAAGGTDGPNLYRLPDSVLRHAPVADADSVWVRVDAAGQFSGRSIAYEVEPNRYEMTKNNLWADSVTDMAGAALANRLNDLAARRPGGRSFTSFKGDAKTLCRPRLSVRLEELGSGYDGNVRLSASAIFFDENCKLAGGESFSIREPLRADGYGAMVEAFGRAFDALAEQIWRAGFLSKEK